MVYYNRTVSPELNFYIEPNDECAITAKFTFRPYSGTGTTSVYHQYIYNYVMPYEGVCLNAVTAVTDGRIYCTCNLGTYPGDDGCY